MLRAEKRERIPLQTAWSRVLAELWDKIKNIRKYTNVTNKKLKKLVSTNRLNLKETRMVTELLNNQLDLRELLTKALLDIKKTRRKASDFRIQFLHNYTIIALLQSNMTRDKMFRNIMRYEQYREYFRRIRWNLKDRYQGSTHYIEEPTHTEWSKITETDIITEKLTAEADNHCRQDSTTTFVSDGHDSILRSILSDTQPTEWQKLIKQRI